MLKRTKGTILLALLVVTGLAGVLQSNSLTKKERKLATDLCKESRNEVFKVVRGLSEAQLNFRPSAEQWSVKECVQHIALTEELLWNMLQESAKKAPEPEKRSSVKLDDDQVINMMRSRERKVKTFQKLEPVSAPWSDMPSTLKAFKDQRQKLIQYLRTTTQDLRNHIIESPLGTVDAYQFALLIPAHTQRHLQQIEEVMENENFPDR